MYVSLSKILKHGIFSSNIEILAGKDGLERKVKRISVFDCPCNQAILKKNILVEGDLFITCLEQFQNNREGIYEYIHSLIEAKSSGLLIVTDGMLEVITETVKGICDSGDYPLVLLKEDIPYAVIMDTINKYVAVENINLINMLKLEKIMYGNNSGNEKMETLYSINRNIRQYVRTVYVDGEINSELTELELQTSYLNKGSDILVKFADYMVLILSENEEKELMHHSDAEIARCRRFIKNPILGFSRIYNRKDIDKALEEGKCSLETAKTMKMTVQEYNPLSVIQLLIAVKDTKEAHDFYKAYVGAIKACCSTENLKEILKTMEVYVANSGSYSDTARIMNQHENTIRYRVNKVKRALNMENDNVKFNETLAIAVKLRTLTDENED